MAEVDAGLVESLSALSRLLQPGRDAFNSMAVLAILAVAGCDHASVSLLSSDGSVSTAGATDDRTLRLDWLQYDSGEGPCLSAIHTSSTVRVDEFASDGRYPVFGPVAAAEGVNSCLSLAVSAAGHTVGGLNLYGVNARAYNEASVQAGEEVAGQVGVLVASSRAYDRSLRLVDQLHLAMASRAEIEQAKGILMARSHCDADQAFDILRRASQRQNVKLRDIAHNIVAATAPDGAGTAREDGI
jgi:GAF domain-containing protein